MSQNALHLVCGEQEAAIIGSALSLFVSEIAQEIAEADIATDEDQVELMQALSAKFTATLILRELMRLISDNEAAIDQYLDGLEAE